MSERFFLESPVGDAATAELIDAEAHHLAKVMRIGVGEEVIAFDGCGSEFSARVAKISKASVLLEIVERREIDRELPNRIAIAVALPKGDRQRYLVEKLVELGVTRMIPLATRRGVAQPVDQALARIRRQVIEASKQCRRNRLMEIAEPCDWKEFLTRTAAEPQRLLAHPGGTAWKVASQPEPSSLVAIGPEGGFTDDEVDAARQVGWTIVSFGPRILRVETAAAAAAVLLAGS